MWPSCRRGYTPANPALKLPGIMRLRVSGVQDWYSRKAYRAASGTKMASDFSSRCEPRQWGAKIICRVRDALMVRI